MTSNPNSKDMPAALDHADGRFATLSFERDGATKVTLGMVFNTEAEFQKAKGFGAVELGMQTLGKLERFVKSR